MRPALLALSLGLPLPAAAAEVALAWPVDPPCAAPGEARITLSRGASLRLFDAAPLSCAEASCTSTVPVRADQLVYADLDGDAIIEARCPADAGAMTWTIAGSTARLGATYRLAAPSAPPSSAAPPVPASAADADAALRAAVDEVLALLDGPRAPTRPATGIYRWGSSKSGALGAIHSAAREVRKSSRPATFQAGSPWSASLTATTSSSATLECSLADCTLLLRASRSPATWTRAPDGASRLAWDTGLVERRPGERDRWRFEGDALPTWSPVDPRFDPRRLSPVKDACAAVRWEPVKRTDLGPLLAALAPVRRDELEGLQIPLDTLPELAVRRSCAPDLDGDGAADLLLHVRAPPPPSEEEQTLGLDAIYVVARRGAAWQGLAQIGTGTWLLGEAPDTWTVDDFVALPGGVGLRGTHVQPPCCDQFCELRGRWVGRPRDGKLEVLADTTPYDCAHR